MEHNHRLNAVNNLPSGPAIKAINSCIGNPLNRLGLFFLHSNAAYSNKSYFPTEYEESVLGRTTSLCLYARCRVEEF